MNALFFWFFSLTMLVSGLAVILNRNAVASLLCFVASIACMSGLFVMLSAYFLAMVEILLTAGAVMVLFLFVIMLLDVTAAEKIPRQRLWMGCALLLGLGFLFLVAKTLNATPQGFVTLSSLTTTPYQETQTVPLTLPPDSVNGVHTPMQGTMAVTKPTDDTHQIGHLLFTTYVAPFEVTSLLILVATVGVIVLCKEAPHKPSPRDEFLREAPPIEPKKETALTR